MVKPDPTRAPSSPGTLRHSEMCLECGSQSQTTNPDPLLDVDEASAYLTIPVKTLYVYRVDGRGPRAIKIGRHLRYRRSDLDAWIDSRAGQGPAS